MVELLMLLVCLNTVYYSISHIQYFIQLLYSKTTNINNTYNNNVKGIKPAWEDPANKKGGELLCRKTMTVDALDTYWENLVLGLIGETVDEQDEICGCRVVDKSKKGNRMMFRLEIWTRTGNAELAEKMKQRLSDVLVEGDSKGGNKLKPLDFEFKSSHS